MPSVTKTLDIEIAHFYVSALRYFFRDVSDETIEDDVLARLQNMRSVVFTSHQAFLTEEALQAIARTTFQSLKEYFVDQKRLNELSYYVEPPSAPAALVRALSRKASLQKSENSIINKILSPTTK